MFEFQVICSSFVPKWAPFPWVMKMNTINGMSVKEKSYHLTRVPIPRFGFCFRRGLVSWVTNVGAEGPIREYSSREMPSGFLILDKFCRFSCDDPVETLFSRDSALRMSAAEPFIVKYWSRQVLPEPCGLVFPTDLWGRISELSHSFSFNRVTSPHRTANRPD